MPNDWSEGAKIEDQFDTVSIQKLTLSINVIILCEGDKDRPAISHRFRSLFAGLTSWSSIESHPSGARQRRLFYRPRLEAPDPPPRRLRGSVKRRMGT
ncbi:hypothetical protein BQ8482_300040 [Mesorhizobium delmotii]|uniref:Uncharacterized protein n=1 Tax=Mesorhizobium delmotii TaxID=1631247 RepID=A0A2P9ANE3_9HYPH|nr:hypothetical protein BQ8482_300040 [Mesorhizobium delmotii]